MALSITMDKLLVVILAVFGFTGLVNGDADSATNSIYSCGIRKRFGIQLIYHGHSAELGQWPWHAALFYSEEYKCGGTLIDKRHVLTSAYCVVDTNKNTLPASHFQIHLGKVNLEENPEHASIMHVSEIHVHEDFITNFNDIALMVFSIEVLYSDHIIPICIKRSIQTAMPDDLEGKSGWTAGWGETENGTLSKLLKTAQMPVIKKAVCVQSDASLFGRFISPNVFCAGDQNGISVCRGDSGGGMYILAGDRWELRGIVSFAGLESDTGSCNSMRYVVFTNVVAYYNWIENVTGGIVDENASVPKRISERKCLEYQKYAKKKNNGVCMNARSPHTVAIIDRNQQHISSGSIISEKFVLTKAPNLLDIFELEVDWVDKRVRVGNQADKKIIREISHLEYDQATYRNHIMLLEMEEELIFTDMLLPACLANKATENLYDTLLMNGYTGLNQTANDFYDNVASKYILNEQCNKSIKAVDKRYSVYKEEICTRFSSDASFTWKGIIGGPLQTVNIRSCMYTLVGVTKFLIPYTESQSGLRYYTNVYSRVTTYLDWIEEVVWECLEYQKYVKKNNGVCMNARSPHTVVIIDSNHRHISSGTIISEKFILTKAPKLLDIFELDVNWDELKVRVGIQVDKKVLRAILHPDYNPATYQNQLMLLELEEKLVFTYSLIPACLANKASKNLFDTLLVSGYTELNQTSNDFYENDKNKIMQTDLCNQSVQSVDQRKYMVYKEEICTRFYSYEPFAWKGIIGGPLQTVNNQSCMYTLVGITKYLVPYNNSQYGLSHFINVYSRVTAYLAWIEGVVWG